jgi:hypothetical protein
MNIETLDRENYSSSDTPEFYDGDIVEVSTHYLMGVPKEKEEYLEGIIVGKVRYSSTSPPVWIVDFGEKWYEYYHEYTKCKYRCVCVQHTLILKPINIGIL